MGSRSKGWWFYFKESLNIYKKSADKVIGHEENGNRYYERYLGGKLKRYVLNDRGLDIPAHPLWRSWLSYKRQIPPTEEEIARDLNRLKQLKQKSDDLFEHDLDRFPEYAKKLKQLSDLKEEEKKKGFPKRDDLMQ